VAFDTAASGDPVTLLWSRTYNGSGVAEGTAITIEGDELYATGITALALGSPGDLFLLKYDLGEDPVALP